MFRVVCNPQTEESRGTGAKGEDDHGFRRPFHNIKTSSDIPKHYCAEPFDTLRVNSVEGIPHRPPLKRNEGS